MEAHVTDDCQDLAALNEGDRDAGRRIYDRHATLIFSICRSAIPSRSIDDAEEAAQETFLRAFRERADVTDCRGFRAWICGIARFVCSERRAAWLRRKRDPETGMQNEIRRAPELPSTVLERRESSALLTAAIEALPHDERLALHLFYIERDPVEAAKRALGISRPTFYRLVAKARDFLAVRLAPEGTQR